MAEFIAAAFGVIIFGDTLSKCSVVTLEIDALSVGFILKDEHAASPGMKAILAELLELPPFQALTSRADRLHTRHAGGEGNPLADSASRGKVDALRRLMGQLGYAPFQVAVPADCTAFLNRVLSRLGRAPHVPVPGTCDPAVAGGSAFRFWGSDDESPPVRFGAQAPAPASIALRREADSPPAAAGPSQPGASDTRSAWLARADVDHADERWQPRRWSAAPAAAAPLTARSRTPSPQPFRPAAPAARPGSSAAAQLQSAEADSSAPTGMRDRGKTDPRLAGSGCVTLECTVAERN